MPFTMKVVGYTLALLVPVTQSRHIFVFGLESSGTRYLSRALAHSITHTNWDGEYPACWTHNSIKVVHYSLPWLRNCEFNTSFTAQAIDLCKTQPPFRFFANITALLKQTNDSKAILIVRNHKCRIPSVVKGHCPNLTRAEMEHKKGAQIMRNALIAVPEQVLLINYDFFGTFTTYLWHKIKSFLELDHIAPSALAKLDKFHPPTCRKDPLSFSL